MDFSKLKMDVYDFLGLIIPGLALILEVWVSVRGWDRTILSIHNLTGTALTVILILSFGVGHLVQELGDKVIKALTGPRFFRQGRDNFWVTEEAKHLRKSLAEDLGHPVVSADHGFDCCLTMIEERFAKRDVFLATSDLCRSFLVLAFLAILPGVRVIKSFSHSKTATIESLAALIGLVLIVSWLSWGRMIRFRELSELTVFRVYAGSRTKKPNTKTADNYQSADRREE